MHLAVLTEVVWIVGLRYIPGMSRRTAIWRVIRNALIITVTSVAVTTFFSLSSVIETAALVLVGSLAAGLFVFRKDVFPVNQQDHG